MGGPNVLWWVGGVVLQTAGKCSIHKEASSNRQSGSLLLTFPTARPTVPRLEKQYCTQCH